MLTRLERLKNSLSQVHGKRPIRKLCARDRKLTLQQVHFKPGNHQTKITTVNRRNLAQRKLIVEIVGYTLEHVLLPRFTQAMQITGVEYSQGIRASLLHSPAKLLLYHKAVKYDHVGIEVSYP